MLLNMKGGSVLGKGISMAIVKRKVILKKNATSYLVYPLPGHPCKTISPTNLKKCSIANRGQRSMNIMTGDTLPPMDTPLHSMNFPDQCSTSNTSDVAESKVYARMDQLQN
ncbi:hypothetical protein Tco_0389776 [Tanacetum coccineum]